MNPKNKYVWVGILLVLTILFSNGISAFAISSAYYNGDPRNPLVLDAGESGEFIIIIQNVGNEEDIDIKVEIKTGSDIIEKVGDQEIYSIPSEEKIEVSFIATIPNDAEPETIYPVSISFSTVADSESGAFGFGSSIDQNFEILIGPVPSAEEPDIEPSISNTIIWLIVIGIIIIIGVIVWLIRRKNKINSQNISQ